MNSTNLEYFVTLAEELNFTQAARKLYISQQALSKMISKLEEKLGIALFDRSTPLRLTTAGQVFYQSAKKILINMDECTRRLQEIKDFTRGNLSIGISVTRGTVLLPQILPKFHRLYPNIHISIFEGQMTTDVDQALNDSMVDLSITHAPVIPNHIVSVPLYKETYMLVVPNDLLYNAFSKEEIENMLIHPPSIGLFRDFPFIAQETTTVGGEFFFDLCNEADFVPNILYTVQNILTELNLCISGAGACTIASTFLPMLTEYEYYNHPYLNIASVTCIKLQTNLESRPLAINYIRGKILTDASKSFIELAKECFIK